jgi:hypothetical protein
MSIFNETDAEKMKNGGNEWLSGDDFEKEGQTLQIIKVEHVSSPYGAADDNYFVQQDILEVGQTFRYVFKDGNGEEKKFDSLSRPFAIAFEQAEIDLQDWVYLTRTGTGKNTRYQAQKVKQPAKSVSVTKPVESELPEEIDVSDIPF